MASGWSLWVWLECIGVVSGCFCKEVYRYPYNYFSLQYSTCISSIFGSSIYNSLILKKIFILVLFLVINWKRSIIEISRQVQHRGK